MKWMFSFSFYAFDANAHIVELTYIHLSTPLWCPVIVRVKVSRYVE